MDRLSLAKPLLAGFVVFGALAAGSAQAGSNVHFSIGVHAPIGYVQPAPVYVQPQPVYVQPQPVYVQPQAVYVQPQVVYAEPVYVQPQPVYYGHHRGHRRGAWGDYDRDGVPNRYDRFPGNPYRR
jgi:hypothetical protein